MSTVLPATEVALAEAVRGKGAAFVECPVGGSTGPARQGKLIGLMGADAADAARARPILEQLCRRLEHAGPVGCGRGAQIRGQSAADGLLAGAGRSPGAGPFAAGRSGTADGSLSDTSGGATIAKVRAPGIAAMLKGGDPGPVTFNVDGGIKDMQAMLAEAKSRGIDLPSSTRRSPVTKKPSAIARATPKSPPSRPIGRAEIRNEVLPAHRSQHVGHYARASLHHRRRRAEKSARQQSCAAHRRRARCRRPPRLRSSAKTNPAFCVSTSPSAKPGARSAWASAHARCASRAAKTPQFLHHARGGERRTHGHQSRRRADPRRGRSTSSAPAAFPATLR